MTKTIYIITPSFNAVNTITSTIYSVLKQPPIFKIRYHVQDGGSKDGTIDILKQISKKITASDSQYSHINFSWSSQQDKGMYHAIALAVDRINIPSNAYMGWINADDLLTPECLVQISKTIDLFPDILWLGGRPCNIDVEGNYLPLPTFYCHANEIIRNGLCDGLHFPCLQQEGMFWKKSLYEAAGGINVALRLAGDWDLWRRMAKYTSFVLLPIPTGIFRRRPGQLSSCMKKYHKEIDSILSRKKRRQALRALFPFKDKMLLAPAIQLSPNKKLTLLNIKPSLSLKSKLRIILASRGCYWVTDLYQALLRIIRRATS